MASFLVGNRVLMGQVRVIVRPDFFRPAVRHPNSFLTSPSLRLIKPTIRLFLNVWAG